MAIAPEPELSACLEVLKQAALTSRVWGWAGTVSPEHLADLMDAIHNIPDLVRDWERCDTELLRATLDLYEKRWKERGGLALLDIFDQVVSGERA